MTDRYLVRCTAAAGRAMAWIYAARLTATGIVAIWKRERATEYDEEVAATIVARRLERKLSGTTWGVSHG